MKIFFYWLLFNIIYFILIFPYEKSMKIICTRGLPASWKSTWSKEQKWAQRFNKDSIRKVLWINSKNWSPQRESEVISKERIEVQNAIKKKIKLIIVDNTHIWKNDPHIRYYEKLANKHEYIFEIKDFYISRDEAIKRDLNREASVWKEVIDKMISLDHRNKDK